MGKLASHLSKVNVRERKEVFLVSGRMSSWVLSVTVCQPMENIRYIEPAGVEGALPVESCRPSIEFVQS